MIFGADVSNFEEILIGSHSPPLVASFGPSETQYKPPWTLARKCKRRNFKCPVSWDACLQAPSTRSVTECWCWWVSPFCHCVSWPFAPHIPRCRGDFWWYANYRCVLNFLYAKGKQKAFETSLSIHVVLDDFVDNAMIKTPVAYGVVVQLHRPRVEGFQKHNVPCKIPSADTITKRNMQIS